MADTAMISALIRDLGWIDFNKATLKQTPHGWGYLHKSTTTIGFPTLPSVLSLIAKWNANMTFKVIMFLDDDAKTYLVGQISFGISDVLIMFAKFKNNFCGGNLMYGCWDEVKICCLDQPMHSLFMYNCHLDYSIIKLSLGRSFSRMIWIRQSMKHLRLFGNNWILMNNKQKYLPYYKVWKNKKLKQKLLKKKKSQKYFEKGRMIVKSMGGAIRCDNWKYCNKIIFKNGMKNKMKHCKGCYSVSYCRKKCQKMHWKYEHNKQCAKTWSKLKIDVEPRMKRSRTLPQGVFDVLFGGEPCVIVYGEL